MDSIVPEHLKGQQEAVEAQIRDAFCGVTRADGVSWSESVVIDNYGTDEERVIARAEDKDRYWEDLVDDPHWNEQPGIGGFNFLDAGGFAYYIAPAMIRCARRGFGEFVGYALECRHDLTDRITPSQAAAVAQFVRFMIAVHEATDNGIYGESWKKAYEVLWRRWDVEDRSG